MNGRKDISTLNCRVVIKQWDWSQDSGGGNLVSERESWTVWANKRNRSGSQFNQEAQQQFQYDTTFTVRYDSRFKSNMTVDHGIERWLINSIEIDNEAYKGMMLLRCSMFDVNIDLS